MATKKIPVDYLEEMWNKESPTQDDMRSVIGLLHKVVGERDRWYRVHHSHVRYNRNVVVNLERKHKYCKKCGMGGALLDKGELEKRFAIEGDPTINVDGNTKYCAMCAMAVWKNHYHMMYNEELLKRKGRLPIARNPSKPSKSI